jgi:hypothetical protein
MRATRKEMKELMGEHEAIMAYMGFLARSLDSLATQPVPVGERIWSYCWGLSDFRDAIRYHLEVDERIFKALPDDACGEDPMEEHRAIQDLLNDMVQVADITIVDKLGQEELNQYTSKIGIAFNKICRLIELHIIKENTILERVQKALNNR